MIINNICGGVGNQMFQIAAGYSLALDNNDDYGINYNIQHHLLQGNTKHKYKDNLFKNVPSTDEVPVNQYQEPFHHHKEIPYQEPGMMLHGYLQSEKYFKHNADKIKQLFTFPDDVKDRIHKAFDKIREAYGKRIVGMHVRRGDYLDNPHIHPTCSPVYYKYAQKTFEDSVFVVATDTPDWVASNLCNDNTILCNSKDELEDMYMLTQCDDVIMSNSTFAWWGAWLNNNNPKVIVPKLWFGPGGPQDYEDIYCDHWEQQ
jgi:hypothetical protein